MSGPEETDAVGRVLGTEDSTPLKFWVAVGPEPYLQLDDVVVTTRDVPGRRAGARSPAWSPRCAPGTRARTFGSDVFLIADGVLPGPGAGGRRDRHHPGRAGGATCRRGRARSVRRAVGEERDQALYFDQMDRKVAGRARPRRQADLRQPRLPRRHPRRARVDQRHLRGGDQDQLRAVPAALAVPLRRARRAGPPTPRRWCSRSRARTCCSWTRRTPGSTTTRGTGTRGSGCRPSRSPRSASSRRRCPATSTGRPNVTGRTGGVDARSGGRSPSSARGELLPYVFADVEDERNQYTMVVHQVAARLRVETARRPAPTAPWTVDGHGAADLRRAGRLRRGPGHRRGHPVGVGRAGGRHRHGQRVRPPAALVAQADPAAGPGRPAGAPAAGDHRRPAGHRRRPAQAAGARPALRRRRGAAPPRPSARRRPGPAGCCSP